VSGANRVSAAQLIVGLAILAAGLVLTLDRMHLLHAKDFLRFWPSLLVLAGLAMAVQRRGSGRLSGLILAALGVWLQLYFLGWVAAWPGDFFAPIVLLLLGLFLVLGGLRRRAAGALEADSWVNAFAFWTGLKRRTTSPDFRGAELTAIMGGIELDLTQAQIPSGRAEIHVFSMWGGVELKVPKDWRVDIPLLALLGGYDDKTEQTPAPGAPVLVLKGFVLMAGLDIKN